MNNINDELFDIIIVDVHTSHLPCHGRSGWRPRYNNNIPKMDDNVKLVLCNYFFSMSPHGAGEQDEASGGRLEPSRYFDAEIVGVSALGPGSSLTCPARV